MFRASRGEYLDSKIETADIRSLKKIQLRKVRAMVKLAYDHSPFYHRSFRSAGMLPEDILTFEDFARKVPICNKDSLRAEIESRRDYTSGIVPFPRSSFANVTLTSGTTGPNTFAAISKSYLSRFLTKVALREYWMAKLRPSMRALMPITGWHFFGLAQNLTLTEMGVECVSPCGTNFMRFIPNFYETLVSTRPDYIITIPWILSALVEHCLSKGVEPRRAFGSVKYVSVAGEGLTPKTRTAIIDELGIEDLFESGGSVDGMWGGSDCYAHAGHHVWMDANHIEIVDPENMELVGEEERGTILSTNLVPGASLFIRFDCQDYGTRLEEVCVCGRTHNRVEIFDRLANVVEISGRRISSYDVALCFESMKETRRCNFTILRSSDKTNRLRLRASFDHVLRNSERDRLANKMRSIIRNRLSIDSDIEWVDLDRLPLVGRKVKRVS